MKTLTNNEGQNFPVNQAMYNALQQAWRDGNFSTIIQDANGDWQCILLEVNFNF